MITKQGKKLMIDKLCEIMDTLESKGHNSARYRNMLEPMSVEQFDKWWQGFMSNEKANFNLEVRHYDFDTSLENIHKAAKIANVELYDYVYNAYRKRPCWTKHKIPILWSHIKRPEQMTSKKNSQSISINKINPKTGQVIGKSKNSRSSDMENIALITVGNEELLAESLGPKADDTVMKADMLKQIAATGVYDISKSKSSPQNKVALNTYDVYLTACGIKTDLVTGGLLLTKTLLQKQNRAASNGTVKLDSDL